MAVAPAAVALVALVVSEELEAWGALHRRRTLERTCTWVPLSAAITRTMMAMVSST